MTQDDLPFKGVKVLDLSQGVAGPYCGMHLARNGADVIKFKPTGSGCWSRQRGRPKGDHTAHSVIVNRAKRSLSVDLKTAEGLMVVQRLAWKCDILIQNYRVGKIYTFELDDESVRKANPEVVYLSITGFGPKGPRSDQPATDSVMQAYPGMMSINRCPTGIPQRIETLGFQPEAGTVILPPSSSILQDKSSGSSRTMPAAHCRRRPHPCGCSPIPAGSPALASRPKR
jgi:crotonobetainyl-CoA:carnitine CoA-transferase CaiB-like acyl-CoA transferase